MLRIRDYRAERHTILGVVVMIRCDIQTDYLVLLAWRIIDILHLGWKHHILHGLYHFGGVRDIDRRLDGWTRLVSRTYRELLLKSFTFSGERRSLGVFMCPRCS
jgi:hypothetical protein